MADRIIRDELWQSIRWLDLPSDTHRLVYVSLVVTIADDYGNLEGGPRRLYRWMEGYSQVKTEPDAIKLMSDLQDADMVRRYEVDGKEYWHLPRFKNSRRYWSRKCPRSPFKEQVHKESKYELNQGSEKNPDADLPQTYRNPRRGVGVGVGVGEVHKEGLSISPTRGEEVKVKPVYKKSSKPQRQKQIEDPVERNRRIANAVVSGDLELAREIKAGRA